MFLLVVIINVVFGRNRNNLIVLSVEMVLNGE